MTSSGNSLFGAIKSIAERPESYFLVLSGMMLTVMIGGGTIYLGSLGFYGKDVQRSIQKSFDFELREMN
jgi:hypothetical protein